MEQHALATRTECLAEPPLRSSLFAPEATYIGCAHPSMNTSAHQPHRFFGRPRRSIRGMQASFGRNGETVLDATVRKAKTMRVWGGSITWAPVVPPAKLAPKLSVSRTFSLLEQTSLFLASVRKLRKTQRFGPQWYTCWTSIISRGTVHTVHYVALHDTVAKFQRAADP